MATRPNEIVSEAMARALLGGMSHRYSIVVAGGNCLGCDGFSVSA